VKYLRPTDVLVSSSAQRQEQRSELAASYEQATSAQVAARGLTLEAIVADIADLVTTRHALGLHHGVILIPEGLVEFVPSMRILIAELNDSIGTLPEIG
jgi:hypothetical protein